jgi:hypothetical protein
MNRILEHKQIIHVVSEVVIIASVSYFFYQKNRKLSQEIENLTQLLQEQQNILEKHESLIKKLLQNQNYQQTVMQNKPKVVEKVKAIRKEVVLPSPPIKEEEEEPELPRVIRLDEPEEKNDSDLDDEIQSELNELS